MFSEDMERHCDETVLNEMGKGIKKKYSFTLLKLSSDSNFYNASVLEFGENTTKRRIKNILNYKKPTAVITVSALIMVLAVGCAAFVKPSPSGSADMEKVIPAGFMELSCDIPFDTDFSTDTYSLSVSLPENTAEYSSLEYYDEGNPLCLIKFTRG